MGKNRKSDESEKAELRRKEECKNESVFLKIGKVEIDAKEEFSQKCQA